MRWQHDRYKVWEKQNVYFKLKDWCEVLAEDGSDDELIACGDKSNSDQEYHSVESGSGNNDAKTPAD
jgi:hypothetical protein